MADAMSVVAHAPTVFADHMPEHFDLPTIAHSEFAFH
jgi:hypothetical protein